MISSVIQDVASWQERYLTRELRPSSVALVPNLLDLVLPYNSERRLVHGEIEKEQREPTERKIKEIGQAHGLLTVLFLSPRRTRFSMYRITMGFPKTRPLARTHKCQRKEIQGGAYMCKRATCVRTRLC